MTDLDALEAVLAKATQGKWEQDPIGDFYIRDGAGNVVIRCDQNETRDLIILLHNSAPALIAEHRAALARVAQLGEALGWFLTDERFIVSVGGNPNVVDKMLSQARAALEPKP